MLSMLLLNTNANSYRCMTNKVIVGLTYLYSVFGMICDFTFAVLPVFLIRSLQMDRQTKFALIPILGMGCM